MTQDGFITASRHFRFLQVPQDQGNSQVQSGSRRHRHPTFHGPKTGNGYFYLTVAVSIIPPKTHHYYFLHYLLHRSPLTALLSHINPFNICGFVKLSKKFLNESKKCSAGDKSNVPLAN
eukprot:GHVP01008909.1.p1 GENE.GHVP01008909.1~~GHVP01008909.1.p1  ORF type:complete len:119 (+),score=2.29 GHVP01008909.1:1110-1466(+)